MKRTFEKIALILLVCLGLLYILIFTFVPFGWVDIALFDNRILRIIIVIISVLFIADSVYLLVSMFSTGGKLRYMLLFSDSESVSKANSKVVRELVMSCFRQIGGAHCNKIKISEDDKFGFKLILHLSVKNDDAEGTIDKLRCLIADIFYSVLGVKFNSIDFVIDNLRTKYKVDMDTVNKQAAVLKQKRSCSRSYVDDAIESVYDNAEAVVAEEAPLPQSDDKTSKVVMEEATEEESQETTVPTPPQEEDK